MCVGDGDGDGDGGVMVAIYGDGMMIVMVEMMLWIVG